MGNIYEGIEKKSLEDNGGANTDEIISSLMKVGSWVEERDNIKFRDNEINRLYDIMNKSTYRTALIVGDMGCGKRSIIEGMIKTSIDRLNEFRVLNIDFQKVLSNVNSGGSFEKIMKNIMSVCYDDDIVPTVLNINDFGHMLNLNCYGNAGFAFYNNILISIREANIRIIATCTTDEFKNIEDNYGFILDYFEVIKLTELTKDQSIEILKDDINDFNETFNVVLPEGVETIICESADHYVKGRPFPLKAEILLDEVCSHIVSKYANSDEIKKLAEENDTIKNELTKAYSDGDIHKCKELTEKAFNIYTQIGELRESRPSININDQDILEAIGSIVNVSMTKLSKDQTEFLKNMPVELKKDVIGQDDAIDTVVKNIRRNRLGLRKTNHSAGNFMFIGSTGVGKTHLAKSLAKYLYGSEEELLRFDMSEFQSEIDVSKLLGSAPGYVGYKESGLLVKGLAKKPESVVLFDEIEKAHTKIYDVLLQLLDEGFITGSDGKKVDASKALIIFTSNIGVKNAKEFANPIGFSVDFESKKNSRKEDIIRKALNKRFSPEFLNRIDNICYFNSLDRDTLKTILYKEIDEMNDRMKTIIKKSVEISPDLEKWLIAKVEKEDNGARPIIRMLQQEIEESVANMIIQEDELMNEDKKVLYADIENDKVIIK